VPQIKTYRKPRALRPGDAVGVVAPASRVPAEDLAAGIALLEDRYEVVTYRDLSGGDGMLSGSDSARRQELQAALDDTRTRAIIAARGGYGTVRALRGLSLEAFSAAPKAVVGFSDLTALLCGLMAQVGTVTVHGPMVCQIGRRGTKTLAPLVRLLEDTESGAPEIRELTAIVPGKAKGPLVGGNLTTLAHLIGTGMFPQLKGAILFIEDVDERPYRLDRCLVHLREAGVLEGLAGVVVGDMTGCEPIGEEQSASEVIASFLLGLGKPAVVGAPAGHGARNVPLPLGVAVEIDGEGGALRMLEPAVSA